MRFSTSSNPRGWTLQVGGWLLYVLLGSTLYLLYGGSSHSYSSLQPVVWAEMGIMAILLAGSYITQGISWRQGWWVQSIRKVMPQVLITHILTAGMSQLLTWGLLVVLGPVFPQPLFIYLLLQVEVGLLLWLALYFGLQSFMLPHEKEIKRWQGGAVTHEVALHTLYAQLSPHVLFNQLNNIRSLVLVDPLQAQLMLTHLRALWHYPVELSLGQLVLVDEELQIVQAYLELEAIQLEERLTYVVTIEDSARQALLPPLLVLHLVRNALEHGIAPQSAGGQLALTVRCDAATHTLCVTVQNTGQLGAASTEAAPPLARMRAWLHTLFGARARLTLAADGEQPDMVMAQLQLPLTF